MKKFLLSGVAAAGLVAGLGIAASQPAEAAILWPSIGNDTLGPALIIVITDSGISTIAGPGNAQGPYDGVEDTYIGVVNNSTHTVTGLGAVSSSQTIFGFDGDGIGAFPYNQPTNASDTSSGKYGGPDTFFTGINGTNTAGTISFVTALAAGNGACASATGVPTCATFFSLEEPLTINSIVFTPEPTTLAVLGAALAGLGLVRRRRKA